MEMRKMQVDKILSPKSVAYFYGSEDNYPLRAMDYSLDGYTGDSYVKSILTWLLPFPFTLWVFFFTD